MYPYDNNDERWYSTDNAPKQDAEPAAPEVSSSDAAGGEYRLIRPDEHRGSYRDADYVPEGSAADPPRYYVPQDKPPKPKKPAVPKGQLTFSRVVGLCLVCALLGGLAGGYVSGGFSSPRSEVTDPPVLSTSEAQPTPASQISSGAVSSQDIYALACSQVVGVSTDITGRNVFGMAVSGSVTGSGFIITTDGYIMTNYHVIESAYQGGYEITVMLYSGEKYPATIVGFDSENDIAVLKIDADGLSAVELGNSDSIGVGDTVYAVGNPLGELNYTMTSGIVSATDRVITTDESTSINMFQIDAAVNSGNSGGPVYGTSGQVVGVVTAKYSETGVEGLGFAIPINDAVSIANDLISKGYVSGRPYMGVNGQTISSSAAQYYNMPLGAYITYVEAGSAADVAGIKLGDIITAMDGTEITSYEGLKAAVKTHAAGDTVSFTLWRSGEYISMSITFDESKPASAERQESGNNSNSYGDYGDFGNYSYFPFG